MTTPAPPPSELELALRQIREDNGGVLTAAVIVLAAAAPDHPLHSRFEWRDNVAARRYRLQQARQLVRVVREQYTDKRGEPQTIRVFHSVHRAGVPGRSYEPMEAIQKDNVLTQQVKRQMEVDWRNLQRRYRMFTEFTAMVRRAMAEDEDDGPLAMGDEE